MAFRDGQIKVCGFFSKQKWTCAKYFNGNLKPQTIFLPVCFISKVLKLAIDLKLSDFFVLT